MDYRRWVAFSPGVEFTDTGEGDEEMPGIDDGNSPKSPSCRKIRIKRYYAY